MHETAPLPAARELRGRILIRFLYTVLFLMLLLITVLLVQLCIVFQYLLALSTLKVSEPVRRVGNQLAVYAYRLIRYMTFNENLRPFPFREFPQILEPGVEEVTFV